MNIEEAIVLFVATIGGLAMLVTLDILLIFVLNSLFDMPPIEPRPLMEQTAFGWALVSDSKPPRGETNLWLKTPERHVYGWEGDNWVRYEPPETYSEGKNLPHG